MTQTMTPVPQAQRIEAMDVLRGAALLGILLMNIESFGGPLMIATSGLDPTLTGLDRIADAAVYILVQGKFYVLFSLLFGMGFAVMMTRAQAAARPFAALYLRRIFGLLMIGLAHLVLIWSGDILTWYALIALPLLLIFPHVPTGHLPYWAIGIYLIAPLLIFGLGAFGSLMQLEPGMASMMQAEMQKQAAEMQAMAASERAAYGVGGGYAQAVVQRLHDAAFLGASVLLVMIWQVLGAFVLGSWFVRRGAIVRPHEFPRLYGVLRWVALPVGLAMMLLSYWIMPTVEPDRLDIGMGTAMALLFVAGLLMCLGYLAWMLRFLPALRWLAPAGRMALTNYLGQSVVCTLVFYGYGLGYYEQMPRAWQIVFAIALFLTQVALSHWWMSRFRYGPAEWVWRAFTYLQFPPMKRTATA
jgi:uncharacterized protein